MNNMINAHVSEVVWDAGHLLFASVWGNDLNLVCLRWRRDTWMCFVSKMADCNVFRYSTLVSEYVSSIFSLVSSFKKRNYDYVTTIMTVCVSSINFWAISILMKFRMNVVSLKVTPTLDFLVYCVGNNMADRRTSEVGGPLNLGSWDDVR
jgi:hypothetical protein